ncbi:substrate-binding domain-containing protein [Streptomyces sp. NPDC047072]|uniref:substrate-binding domain-containing protein n=1 Tax=Streptomyces sp. NPDC047072 TaxID=3154809 RepID=UPI0033DD93F6
MIFTALPVEHEKVKLHLTSAGATLLHSEELDRGSRAAVYALDGQVPWHVYLVRSGTGNTTTTRVVSRWLAEKKPEAAFFVGIAAGRKDAVRRDVVIAKTVYAYQRGKQTQGGFLARPISWVPPVDVISTAEEVAQEVGPLMTGRIHFKPIASGDTVIDSLSAPDHRIIENSYEDSAAIETEGAGFAEAAHSHRPAFRWLLIRGISDLADGRKKEQEADAQSHAALHAALVAVHILRALDVEPVTLPEADSRPAAPSAPVPDNHTIPLLPRTGSRPPVRSGEPDRPGPPPERVSTRPDPSSSKRVTLAFRRRRRPVVFGVVGLAALLVVGLSVRGFGNDGTGTEGDPTTLSASLKPCDHADVTLHIASSVDKSEPLRRAAKAYGPRSAEGACVQIQVDDKNSGDAMRALAHGWTEDDGEAVPDVWSPAGDAWLALARANATAKTRSLFPQQAEPIVTSPLTVAMPKPMAAVLEWPENTFTWSELADWSTHAKGFWAANNRGKPEWGDFKLGKTNPGYSTSGLNATLGAFYARTGTTGELTEARLDDSRNRAFVKSIEQAAVHYGDTTLTFLSNLRRADKESAQKAMSYISAVTLEENTVAAYNAGYPCGALSTEEGCEPTGKPDTPLVSFYPTDGILFSNHPYIELNIKNKAKKAVADDFLVYLHEPRTFATQFGRYGFRTYDNKVPADSMLRAKDSGVMPDTDLSNSLSTPQDQVLKHLLDIWPTLRRRANVLLLIDTSGSMNDKILGTDQTKLERLKQAETELLGEFTRSDRVGLWKFSDAEDLGGDPDYRELVPLAPYDRNPLSENFRALEAEGATGLYDTLDAATAAMRADYDPKAINAIVLLTDGRDQDKGSVPLATLLQHINDPSKPQVRVFTIAYGSAADEDDKKGRTVLQQIADAGTGQMYDARNADTIEQVITSVISNF